jgi:uncharacterized membrane protein YgcG
MRVASLSLILVSLAALLSLAEEPSLIPPIPQYSVLDEAKVLDDRTLHALQTLVIEHELLTGQKILIALFKSLNQEGVNHHSQLVFKSWIQGTPSEESSILFVIYWKEQKARIITLTSILPEEIAEEIIRKFLLPLLKRNDPSSALSSSTYRILNAVNSPLIENGKADEIFIQHRISNYSRIPSFSPSWGLGVWIFLFPLGCLVFLGVIHRILAREAHFTRAGWFRPPLSRLPTFLSKIWRNTPPWEGGGAYGEW